VTAEFHSAGDFHLEIDGISSAAFHSCSGLGATVDCLEYVEGGGGLRYFRGDRRFDALVLERGVVRGSELWDWFVATDRRDGAVVLLGAGGREVLRWRFVRAWPRRWEGPKFDASRTEVALERLEIVHEGIEWVAR
jgi:phage tail-like protein